MGAKLAGTTWDIEDTHSLAVYLLQRERGNACEIPRNEQIIYRIRFPGFQGSCLGCCT